MSCLSPQPSVSGLARSLAIGVLALSLGGCFARNAEVTGSISGPQTASANDAEALGKRFDAEPASAEAGLAYAQALRSRGQNAQAVAVLQQTALRNPSSLPVMAAYGKTLADAGRFKEAAAILERAHVPERPDWRILSVQGAVADQMGQFANAQRYYVAALKIVPGEPSVLSNQGLSFALVRRLDEAERVLQEAAKDPRADARVRQNLAMVTELKSRSGQAPRSSRRDLASAPVRTNEPPAMPASAEPAAARPLDSWRALRQIDEAAGRHPSPARQAAIQSPD